MIGKELVSAAFGSGVFLYSATDDISIRIDKEIGETSGAGRFVWHEKDRLQ